MVIYVNLPMKGIQKWNSSEKLKFGNILSPMNSLYYTLKDRKSLKTLRIEYGQLGLKFVLRMFEGQIDRRGEREGLPKEILFEDEQKLLKQIHELKKELKENEWSESPPPKVTQPSFLRTDLGEEELSHRFD